MLNFTKFLLLSVIVFSGSMLYAQPTISSFNPKSGPLGTLVTINGTNFNPAADQNIVFFGAVKAHITSASNTSLTVTVPPGATYEPISVTTNTLKAYSADPFNTTFSGGSIDSATFEKKVDYKVLQGAFCVAVGDLDSDGKSDIVYGHEDDNSLSPRGISVLPNTSSPGSISLGQRLDFTGIGTIYDVCIADLNCDGKPEVITGNTVSNRFSVFKNTSNTGAISFAPVMNVIAGTSARGINIADFDNDGRPDVLTVNPLLVNIINTLSIFRNTGINDEISFAPKIEFTTYNGVARITTADVNNDGKVDLVYSVNNMVSVYINTSNPGNIAFGSKVDLGINSTVTSSGDFDGDGKIDLSAVTGTGINFYRNTGTTGTLSFAPPVFMSTGTGFNQTLISDIDGDGKPDLAGFSPTINTAFVLKNNSIPGSISFAGKVGYGTGGRLSYIAGADLDGDSKPEIVSYNMIDSISILRNKTGEPITVSSGANPVTGNVVSTVIVDELVQTYNGNPYVQRHYDIEPEIDPATSTGTITLYFTQEDFDNFNAFPTRVLSLPAGPNDIAGKSNLRVYQYHGTSSISVPGSYSGSGLEINPDDLKIIWNGFLKRWEVTFDITGFSGFFVSSSANAVLPLTLISFDAKVMEGNALLNWLTNNEIGVSFFELQKSIDGIHYDHVTRINATGNGNANTDYDYTDKLGADHFYYYRLKMVDKDGSSKFSNVVKITSVGRKVDFSLYPNPAHGSAVVESPSVNNQSELRLIDMSGKTINIIKLAGNATRTNLNLMNVNPGTYKILWTDGVSSRIQTILVK